MDFAPAIQDAEFVEYTIDLGSIAEWQGTIDQIGWLVAREAGATIFANVYKNMTASAVAEIQLKNTPSGISRKQLRTYT